MVPWRRPGFKIQLVSDQQVNLKSGYWMRGSFTCRIAEAGPKGRKYHYRQISPQAIKLPNRRTLDTNLGDQCLG